jgi:hypothetical protein
MKAKKRDDSPAIQLLDLVWSNCNEVNGHSWERLNGSMKDALSLAISAGMAFDLGDFASFRERYRFGYWGGQDSGGFAEGFYTEAVCKGNMSAAKSFEQWKGRKPFITEDAEATMRYGRRVESRCGGRLTVDSRFTFRGELLTVTSFSDGGEYLTACTYKLCEHDQYRRKIAKRFKITREELLQERRRVRLLELLKDYANKGEAEYKAVRKLLKIRKNTKLDDISCEALEAAVKTLGIKAKEKASKANLEGEG